MSLPWRPQSHRGDVIEPGKQMCSALSPPGTNRTKWITHSNGKISDGNTCPRCLEGSTLHENSLPSLLGRLFLIFAIVVLFGCSWHKALTYDEPLLSPPPSKESSSVHVICMEAEEFLLFSSPNNKLPTSATTTSTVLMPSRWDWYQLSSRATLTKLSRGDSSVCVREAVFFSVALKQCRSDKDPCFPTWGKSDKYICPCVFIRSRRSRICCPAGLQTLVLL